MNREQAIYWCKQLKNLPGWPQSTKMPAPNKWRWVVINKPYQVPEYKLIRKGWKDITSDDL